MFPDIETECDTQVIGNVFAIKREMQSVLLGPIPEITFIIFHNFNT